MISISLRKVRLVVIAVVSLPVLIIGGFTPVSSQANNTLDIIIKKEQLEIDLSKLETDGNYRQPKTILVTPLFLAEGVKIDAREWYRGLFYYFSSDRHGYKDIPAHYVLDQNGKLYEGMEGGVEREIIIEGSDNSPILIYYLAERGETDFTLAAKATLERQLLKLANENSIRPEKIELANIKLAIDEEAKEATLTKETIFGNWVVEFKALRNKIAAKYQPTKKSYQIELVEYKNPAAKVKVGSEVVLKLKLKNTGENTIFADSDSELLLTKADGQDSQMFLNNHWVSKTQMPVLTSGTVLLPDKEKEFDLKIKVPFFVGKYSEEFVLKTAGNNGINSVKIKVELNIDKGDLKILEILNTETGTLNVRRDPLANAPVVDKASPGQRYIWTEQSETGWYKIKTDTDTGWVLGRYVKVL